MLAIEAAVAAGRRIKVVGHRSRARAAQGRYAREAEFLGRVDDLELAGCTPRPRRWWCPTSRSSASSSVEAQAAGRPVVGIDAGGVSETVIAGRTGLLVPDGDLAALARALRSDFTRFDPHDISAHAQQFSRDAFQMRLREVVEMTWAQPEGARRPASHAARSIRRLASERPASP